MPAAKGVPKLFPIQVLSWPSVFEWELFYSLRELLENLIGPISLVASIVVGTGFHFESYNETRSWQFLCKVKDQR